MFGREKGKGLFVLVYAIYTDDVVPLVYFEGRLLRSFSGQSGGFLSVTSHHSLEI